MSLTVETGAGIAGAESYASVAAADAHFAARAHLAIAATWAAAATANKEGALREASAYLDATWGPYYRGTRAGYVQGLQWPRTGANDATGYPLPDLPPEIVAAACELAGRAVSAPLAADADSDGVVTRERVKAGPVEAETEFSGATGVKRFGAVGGMLAPVLNGAQPGARGATWAWA